MSRNHVVVNDNQLDLFSELYSLITKRDKLAKELVESAKAFKYYRVHLRYRMTEINHSLELLGALDDLISNLIDLAHRYDKTVNLDRKVDSALLSVSEPLEPETLANYLLDSKNRLYAKLRAFQGIIQNDLDLVSKMGASLDVITYLTRPYSNAI